MEDEIEINAIINVDDNDEQRQDEDINWLIELKYKALKEGNKIIKNIIGDSVEKKKLPSTMESDKT